MTVRVSGSSVLEGELSTSHEVRRTSSTARRPFLTPWRAGWSVVALQAVVVAVMLSRSYFYVDDFDALHTGATSPLSRHYLGLAVFGHFVPGWRAVNYVLARGAPLAYWPVWLLTVALFAGINATSFLILRRLIGTRWTTVAILFVFAFVPIMTMATFWWAYTLHVLPSTLAALASTLAFLAYLGTGRARHLVTALAAFAVGLCFFEKPLILVGFLPLLCLAHQPGRASLRSSIRLLVRLWRAWVGYGVIAAAYLVVYVEGGYYRASLWHCPTCPYKVASLGDMASFYSAAWLRGLAPALVGGPLQWRYVFPGGIGLAHPPGWLVVLAQVVAVTMVVATIRSRRKAWRAWALAAVMLAVSTGTIARGRLTYYGPWIARDVRYLWDSVPLTMLALAAAFAPSRLTMAARFTGAPDRDDIIEAGDRSRDPGDARTGVWRRLTAAGTGLYLAVFVVLATISLSGFTRNWWSVVPRRYFDALRHDAASTPSSTGTVAVLDSPLPPTVSLAPFPGNMASATLGPLETRLRFGDPTPPLYAIAPSGHLVRAEISPVAQRPAPGTDVCFPAGDSTVALPATSPVAKSDNLTARLVVHGGTDVSMVLTGIDSASAAPTVLAWGVVFPPGGGVRLLPLAPAAWTELRVQISSRGPFCVNDVTVGTARAAG